VDYGEIHFLLDQHGAIVAFEETEQSWAGALAFSTEQRAREFIAYSGAAVREIATLDTADREALAGLIGALKPRAIRYLFLDLDCRSGACHQIEFEGERLRRAIARQFTPIPPHV